MAKIINLNELVGEDIAFEYGTPVKTYAIPGDIPVAKVFELFEMFTNVSNIEATDADAIVGEVRRKFEEIQGRLLDLFRERDPKLETLPFGIRGTGVVLRTILAELGVGVTAEDPQPPSTKRTSGKKTSTAPRSKK